MAPKTATGSFEKSGALFFSLIYFFLNALAETSATVNSRAVLLKQMRYGFLHPVSYVIAQTIADIPVAACQTIVFSCLYYFMLGLAKTASDFWTFFAFVFVHYGAVQAMFRMIGAWSPNLSVALLMAGSGMPVALLYSGYAPTIPTMHRWGSWVRRISPSPWALEALMANEFMDINLHCMDTQMVPSGPDYQDIRYQGCTISGSTEGSDVVSGTTYLIDVYQFFPSHIWRNFVILIAFWVLYTVIAAVGLAMMTRESSDSYGRMFKKGSYSDSASSISTISEKNKEEPQMSFTFNKLSYHVKSGSSEKQLLTEVSGYVRSGQLTALMGASGAGKTTLLDTISQRKSEGRVEGELLLNGKPLDRTFARSCGIVLQQDVHEPTATVQEALQFSARLRQPADVPESEKMAYVEHVIRLLDLESLADALVGAVGDGQLSVEERKRVTIGVELAARPSALLFLDEPTSGLDSQAAYSLVSFLKRIASEGLPIVCTIHQPSGVLFDMFDHVLLLAPGGKTVFFGETGKRSSNVAEYFARYGAIIGENDNPAEFILDTVTEQGSTRDWPATWNESPRAKQFGKQDYQLERKGSDVFKSG
ncbi:ABC-2 type transporter-domain-containing protein [Penicillium malachiteum]|uniref:ABC-2 type transporter-domain-containing protein n=1 Tax=Penicillium malachiteum TaxID=1324776 RepID=UPI0025492C26|nr:ABC-2 type transporter-domain-containing protein [Penicillium malachiteum]KAJ5731293.1 ABC-2 type transporter-domain-containing protein [Penicillium malachiteum]